MTSRVSVSLNRLQRASECWVGRGRAKVSIDGARSMINRPLAPIHFLLKLRALVTQMKMGGQGQSVMMIYISRADVQFWRETSLIESLNVRK